MNVFTRVRESLKNRDLIREVFTFVYASRWVSKLTTWDDRDKVMKAGLEKLNNETVAKVSTDTQARFGSKGNNTFGYGYKEHVSVDMQSGLINKVAASSAEKSDTEGLSPVCPNVGVVFDDKGYCLRPAQKSLKRCHDATIEKNNMKGKNRRKEGWLFAMRLAYERVFAHHNRHVRYRGLEKVLFQVGICALIFNFKRVMALGIEKLSECLLGIDLSLVGRKCQLETEIS